MSMRRSAFAIAIAVMFCAGAATGAVAAAPDYDATPLTAADVDLCLSILRQAVDHANHITGADKDAVAFMRKYHGNPPMPTMPDMTKHLPTQAEIAAYGAQTEKMTAITTRAEAIAEYDETIAQKRGVKDRYDGIKDKFDDVIMSGGTGVVGDGGGPMKNVPAAVLAADRKRIAIDKGDWTLIKPHRTEYQALRKTLRSFEGENY
jgi:hypothetical protein